MNVVRWMYDLSETLKSTTQGVFEFLVKEYNFFGLTFQTYEALFGGILFVVIGYGIVSFITRILP